jgi:succinoglycan biosynthesis protein ExoO
VHVVSRNRVTGRDSGSSAYLLDLCQAMAGAGHELHLTWPSPATFGRTPVLRLRPEMAVFRSISMRGAWRVGPLLLARDPKIWAAAAIGIADKVLRKAGIGLLGGLVRKAPYAVAVPWQTEDFLHVAGRIRGGADVVVADYAFLTPAFPYALSPAARRIVVMHDLFSSRAAQFTKVGAQDSVALIDQASELRLLGAAEAVVAIQREEGALIQRLLPGRQVIVAPVDGEVMDLKFHAPGGVIAPRETIAAIVPSAPKLLVEAQVRPEDIEQVRRGLPADIRFTAFNPRTTPSVEVTEV